MLSVPNIFIENPQLGMSIQKTVTKEISRAVQNHIIRPLADKAIEAAVKHGPTVLKTLAGAVGGALAFRSKFGKPKSSSKQATFRIVEEPEAQARSPKRRKPEKTAGVKSKK
jgi:hypothetical protein